MKVLLYGRLTDAIGREVEIASPAGCSVGELRRRLTEAHPAAAQSLGRSRAVIGGAAIGDDHRLAHADVVEFLPPVSGG